VNRFIDHLHHTDSKLQFITVPQLISTIHKSPQHSLCLFKPAVSSPVVPWKWLLTVEILQRPAHRSFLHWLPYRTACQVPLWSLSLSLNVTTDGQSASLSWNKAPIWGLRPDFYYCQTFAGLLMWGALSDERTGLAVIIGSESRGTRDLFYCLKFETSFSSPPTTFRATTLKCLPSRCLETALVYLSTSQSLHSNSYKLL
jgi:hypothetical protein